MPAITLPVKNQTNQEVVLAAGEDEIKVAKDDTEQLTPEFLLSDSFASALLTGKLAFVKPRGPTPEQFKVGAQVAATLLTQVGVGFIDAERRATAALDERKTQRDAYNRAREHSASMIRAANAAAASASSLVRLADAFLSTASHEGEVAGLDSAVRELEAKLAGKLGEAEVKALLAERDQLRGQLEEATRRQSEQQGELERRFGTLKAELSRAANRMKKLSEDDLGKKLAE